MKAAQITLVPILIVISAWNLMKMPAYFEYHPMTNVTYDAKLCEDPTLPEFLGRVHAANFSLAFTQGTAQSSGLVKPFGCHGMQVQWHLYVMFGTRSPYKPMADPDAFLIPHCAMGVALEVLLVLALIQGTHGLYERSKMFLPLAIVFALHIAPVAKGIPDNLAHAPLNEVIIVLVLLGCALCAKGMYHEYHRKGREPGVASPAGKTLIAGWVVVGLLINIAPVGEWAEMLSREDGEPSDTDDRPHPMSGRDFYSGLGCPWVGKIAGLYVLFTVFMYIFEIYTAAKGEAWRSPFSRRGPAIWQIIREPAPVPGSELHLRPELYLEATGECFVLCMAVSWTVTSMFNQGIFRDNILRSIVGYNNLCVGFDSPPARYVAMPLLVMQAALASRYSYLDTIRLNGTRSVLSGCQYWFGYIANWVFAMHMMCFPMLLVLTAEFTSWTTTKIHLYLFMFTLFIMWLMIAGNVYEAPELELDTKVWFGAFTFHTLALPVVGVLDVLNFHPNVPADQIYTIRYEKPDPAVPWPITAYLDYGWFLLLLLTVVFLPHAPPVRTQFQCSPEDLAATRYGKQTYEAVSDEDLSREDSNLSGSSGSSRHSEDSAIIGKSVCCEA